MLVFSCRGSFVIKSKKELVHVLLIINFDQLKIVNQEFEGRKDNIS